MGNRIEVKSADDQGRFPPIYLAQRDLPVERFSLLPIRLKNALRHAWHRLFKVGEKKQGVRR